MNRYGLSFLAFGLTVLCVPAIARAAPPQRVGVVFDGSSRGNDAIVVSLRSEADSLSGAGAVVFPDDKRIEADWTAKGVAAAVDKLLVDNDVDIVVVMGVLATNDVAVRTKLRKPVIAPFVLDRDVQAFPFSKGTSGRKNLSYLIWPWSLDRELRAFHEIIGGAQGTKLVFLLNEHFLNAVTNLEDRVNDAARAAGVDLVVVPLTASVDDALDGVPSDAGGVLLGSLGHLPEKDAQRLVDTLTARKLPTYTIIGEQEVRRGVLAGIRPASDFEKITRRIAVDVERIRLGDDPGTFPVHLKLSERLIINMGTAQAIGLSPSWAVLTEAELVNDVRNAGAREVSLPSVMRDALDRNLELSAARDDVSAGKAEVRVAKANLFPQIDLSTTARTIDLDHVSGIAGQPRHLWTADVEFTQILYSEKALAGLDIQRDAQRARAADADRVELDVTEQVAVAYLNVLRAATLEKIQRANLRATRTNLDLARVRVDVGTANRAELFRWESQLASDRKAVIDASSQRNKTEIELNRVLAHPVEDPLVTAETGLDDPALLTSDKRLFRLIENPARFKLFRQFMVAEALAASPELKAFDSQIRAAERILTSTRRSHWSPTLALTGSVTQRLGRFGAGSDAMPDEPSSLSWFAGVNLSVPLFEGGAVSAEVDKNHAELSSLKKQRTALRDKIAQRVSAALHTMGASHASIGLTRQSADAADENLELVGDAYGGGSMSILELLDAQTAALNSNQLAANAVYDFLIDWMNVQRAVGMFDVLMDDEQRRDFLARAESSVSNGQASVEANE